LSFLETKFYEGELRQTAYTGLNIATKGDFTVLNGVYITRKYWQMELLGPDNSTS
jgi:hypothetical protein